MVLRFAVNYSKSSDFSLTLFIEKIIIHCLFFGNIYVNIKIISHCHVHENNKFVHSNTAGI